MSARRKFVGIDVRALVALVVIGGLVSLALLRLGRPVRSGARAVISPSIRGADTLALIDSLRAMGRMFEVVEWTRLADSAAYRNRVRFVLPRLGGFTVLMESATVSETGAEIWTGQIDDVEGEVILVRVDGEIEGFVHRNDGEQLRLSEIDGIGTVIESIRSETLGEELTPLAPDAFVPYVEGSPAAICEPSVVDVLVVYDPRDETMLGGRSAVLREVEAAVAFTNIALRNNATAHRIRLAKVAPLQLPRTVEFGSVLSDARFGRIDGLAALRDQVGADVTFFWMPDGGSVCGLAYVLDNAPKGRPELAFGAVARRCAISTWTLAHEMGHLFGAEHDRRDAGAARAPIRPARPYAYGYQDALGAIRDIMATQCLDTHCARLAYYSSPTSSHAGRPFGIAHDARPDSSADVARLINETACLVASYRNRGATGVP